MDTTGEFYPKDRGEWRRWLEKNHRTEKNVWVVIPHAGSSTPGVPYEDATQEAICFGWIDSLPRKRDDTTQLLRFSRRNPKSKWSKKNRDRAERMIAAGLMSESGIDSIRDAKESGTWLALESVQKNEIPADLAGALERNPAALKNFTAFPPSSKRIILEWIQNAKKEETRKKRIQETVRLAADNIRANHYRQ